MNTWIKLYRKILQNDSLFRSAHTFTVWCWLLLMADHETGVVKCGRFQISNWLKIKPSTVYITLKRLENLTMIQMKPDNKMTTISILNWDKYQNKPNTKITTNQQQNNTIQEYKNKNKEIKNNTNKHRKENKLTQYEEDYGKWLAEFNSLYKTKYNSKVDLNNYARWRESYSAEDMAEAIKWLPQHEWLKDKKKPTLILRTADTGKNPVDRIGELLSVKSRYESQFL